MGEPVTSCVQNVVGEAILDPNDLCGFASVPFFNFVVAFSVVIIFNYAIL